MRKKTLADYAPGTRLQNVGLRVLDIVLSASPADKTIYLVRYDCCGDVAHMSRRTIAQRGRDESVLCRTCSRRARGKKKASHPKKLDAHVVPYGLKVPSWPVPCRAMLGVTVPHYDRAYLEFG